MSASFAWSVDSQGLAIQAVAVFVTHPAGSLAVAKIYKMNEIAIWIETTL